MFFGFQEAYFGSQETFDARVVEYGAIPYEITHPGDQCVEISATQIGCGAGRRRPARPPGSPSSPRCSCTAGCCTSAATCCSSGSSATTSRTRWARAASSPSTCSAGVVAVLAQTVIDPNAAVPTIGASGAVAAVLGGYALLYPRARVVTLMFIIIFFTIIELPALLVLGAWFAAPGAVNGASELTQPVGERRRRRLLRPHRRLPVRAGGDQAVRQPRARGLRAGAPNAGLLMNARTAACSRRWP